jgi:2-polyprenyl-3-methyl-5-hydroxy-6-metoxy-1,4-benzoquinol methylase
MDKRTEQNKTAWEYNAYDFWVSQSGTPAERAKKDLENPRAMLKNYSKYFDDVRGVKIANICGSCGKKAVPLSILGASVTVFDISRENMRYACETAHAAGTHIE